LKLDVIITEPDPLPSDNRFFPFLYEVVHPKSVLFPHCVLATLIASSVLGNTFLSLVVKSWMTLYFSSSREKSEFADMSIGFHGQYGELTGGFEKQNVIWPVF
jgi:hypothetical protein